MEEAINVLSTPKNISASLLLLLSICVLPVVLAKSVRFKFSYYPKLIALYIIAIIFQLLIGYYAILATKINSRDFNIVNVSAYIFILLEFTIFVSLIRFFISSPKIKTILLAIQYIFPIIWILVWLFNKSFIQIISSITAFESSLLILACLYYFYEILNNPPTLILSKEPSFWIVSGILFLFVCITPFYLFFAYFITIPEMQIIDHVAYDLIVILFTKACCTLESKK